MLKWGHIRFNNISVCWNVVTCQSITHEWATKWLVTFNAQKTETMTISRKIDKPDHPPLYMDSNDIYTVSEHKHIIDSYGTSFQCTDVLLILIWPLSNILICYWFSWYLIPAYWCFIDSHVTFFQHTDVLLIFRLHHSSILMCY
jgi:hypothetical protein